MQVREKGKLRGKLKSLAPCVALINLFLLILIPQSMICVAFGEEAALALVFQLSHAKRAWSHVLYVNTSPPQ